MNNTSERCRTSSAEHRKLLKNSQIPRIHRISRKNPTSNWGLLIPEAAQHATSANSPAVALVSLNQLCGLACKNSHFSSVFAAEDVSRGIIPPRETSRPTAKSEEERLFFQANLRTWRSIRCKQLSSFCPRKHQQLFWLPVPDLQRPSKDHPGIKQKAKICQRKRLRNRGSKTLKSG